MVIYYRQAGFISVFALVSNVLLVFALLAGAGATLTLPGIAGIALTIGMAVDCNIIIYERIREELRLGKNARAAVGTGFDKPLLAVLDANITTFIAGVEWRIETGEKIQPARRSETSIALVRLVLQQLLAAGEYSMMMMMALL